MNKFSRIKKILALVLYGAAMAMAEAAVVVYLWEIYYPKGFLVRSAADLLAIPPRIFRVELWREAATILTIAAVAYLSFENLWKNLGVCFRLFRLGLVLLYFSLCFPPLAGFAFRA